jgi:hypothetical protein
MAIYEIMLLSQFETTYFYRYYINSPSKDHVHVLMTYIWNIGNMFLSLKHFCLLYKKII